MSDTSANEIFGQIGAAKIFTSSVSSALDIGIEQNQDKIKELEEQLKETESDAEKKKIQKKIDKLKKKGQKAKKVIDKATDMLGKLAKAVDIGKKTLIKWVAQIITTVLPGLEVAVKMLLLSNIKKMVSCSIDARIPDAWRSSGVTINELEIDPRQILRNSPYSTYGRSQYSGVFSGNEDETGEPTHCLARATDMNAFIWYVKNCAKYASPFIIDKGQPESSGLSCYFECKETDTLYNTSVLTGKTGHNFLEGCTFKQTANSNTIFMCMDRSMDDSTGKYVYEIFPVSETLKGDRSGVVTGCNWYKGTKMAITSASNSRTSKAKPLFKLDYSNSYNSSAYLPRNNFKFQILPAPFKLAAGFITDIGQDISATEAVIGNAAGFVLGEDVTSATTAARQFVTPNITSLMPHYARFSADGAYNKKGKFTVNESSYYVHQDGYYKWKSDAGEKILVLELIPRSSNLGKTYYLLYFVNQKKFEICSEFSSDGTIMTNCIKATAGEASSVLIECYTGKTIYEFNYEYIMSFKLFDADVIASNLINSMLNVKFNTSALDILGLFKKSGDSSETSDRAAADQLYIDNMVDQMVQSIIDEQSEEYSDCFYTFSNDEYVALENKTNQQLANGTLTTSDNTEISEALNMIKAYSADASLHEQTEVITNSLTKVANITESAYSSGSNGGSNSGYVDDTDEDGNSMDFFTTVTRLLVTNIVNAILTPKVLMLIQVNQKLMGNDPLSLDRNYSFSVADVLNGMKGIITSVVKEVIDTILQELLRLIMKYIAIILSSYIQQLAKEYAEKWVNLLKQLLACFQFNKSSLSSQQSDGDNTMGAISSALDTIEGADIDALSQQLIPNTNPC